MAEDPKIPVGTIGGEVILGSSDASWFFTEGTSPYKTHFDVMPDAAARLVDRRLAPLELILGDLKVDQVFVTQEVAGDVPAIARIEVVDRRWFWTRGQMYYEYNKRQKTGVKRMTAINAPPVAQAIAATIGYWAWSMNNGTAWNGADMLGDVFKFIQETEKKGGAPLSTYRFDGGLKQKIEAVPIEGVLVKGDAAACLANVLDYLPGVGCKVNAKGEVVFFDKTSGAEVKTVKALGAEKVGGGHVRTGDCSNIRPQYVDVNFLREIELRADFDEDFAPSNTTTVDDVLYLENVMPVPDFSVTIAGQVFPRNSWVKIKDILAAWGNAPWLRRNGPLTLGDLAIGVLPYSGILEAMGLLGVASADVNWVARITTALAHYRRTYRINPKWLGRMYSIKAQRVATLDYKTGTRGNGAVFTDYSYLGTTRSLYHDVSSGQDLSYATSQAVFDGGNFKDGAVAAPANLHILDADQGIVRIELLLDEGQARGQMFPSQIELNGDNTQPGVRSKHCGPTGNLLDKTGRPIGFDILSDPNLWPQLTAKYKMAIVFTAIPALATARGKGTFSKPFETVKVTPDQCAAFPGQSKCYGPPLEIVIGPGFATALVQWLDTSKSDIFGAFGIGTGVGDISNLVLNGGKVTAGADPANQGSLPQIALAAAQRFYNITCDRPFGGMTGTLVPGIEPVGWIGAVGYSLAAGTGEASTSIHFPESISPLALESYMDAGLRKVWMRIAGNG